MTKYTPEEVKYKLAVANKEIGEMALTYIHELEQTNFQLRGENKQLKINYKILSCSVDNFDELQDKLEEEQRKNNRLSDSLTKAKELLAFWINNFYDAFNKSIKYDEKHKALVETEQFLKEDE